MMRTGLILTLLLLISHLSYAETIILENGDKITGDVIEETDGTLTILTQAMGEVEINKNFIKPKAVLTPASDVIWERKATIGYSQSGGNTDKNQFSGIISINRKTDYNEFTAKWSSFIASTKNEEDSRKFYGMARYAYSFGDELKWYHFTKLEGDQDLFANVEYRITPSMGLGYWFSDELPLKAMVEVAFGFEHTNYEDNTKSENEAVLVPRGFIEKKLTENLTLKEDATLYPSLGDFGEFRLHSESSLISKINSKLSWRLSFIDDYNSDPKGASKKNDYRLISAIDIHF